MTDMPTKQRLILVTPSVTGGAFAEPLAEACRTADVAAVLLRLAPMDERAGLDVLKTLVAAVQETGAAALLVDMPDMVGRSGADGVHATGIAAVEEAIDRFHPGKIVGAGGLVARDDAMRAGEIGADYVLFGDTGPSGRYADLDGIVERTSWWAEIFAPPCAAMAHGPDAVVPLAATGAEFVGLEVWVWSMPDPLAAIRSAGALLAGATERP